MEEVTRRHLAVPSATLGVLLLCLLTLAVLPAAAAAGPGDCDIPAVKETTEVEVDCEGDIEDITGVPTGGGEESLPPEEQEPDPIVIRRCSPIRTTGVIRADNVDCKTAHILARRAGNRRRYRALGFTCTAAGRKISCFRASTGPADEDGGEAELIGDDIDDEVVEDGDEAGYVVFTLRSRR